MHHIVHSPSEHTIQYKLNPCTGRKSSCFQNVIDPREQSELLLNIKLAFTVISDITPMCSVILTLRQQIQQIKLPKKFL